MAIEQRADEILDELAQRIEDRIPLGPPMDDALFNHIDGAIAAAQAHAHVGEEIPAHVKARPLRKALVTGLRPVTAYQRVFNEQIVEALRVLAALLRSQVTAQQLVEPRLTRMNASVSTIDVAIDELAEELVRLASRTGLSTAKAFDDTADSSEESPREPDISELAVRIRDLESRLARLEATPRTEQEASPEAREPSEASARLYAEFENTFRGSREAVRGLLEPYVADIRAAAPDTTTADSRAFDAPVIDIGCGRGEWLEILSNEGIPAYGIDTNPVTVADCVERGLDVRLGDALEHLGDVPAGSLASVTGFHIAEHVEVTDLVRLIELASQALVPGGSLILETPNCTNLMVGASSFYLDPTHLRPVHPQLLEFLCRSRGFAQVEVRYLHPRRPTMSDRDAPRNAGLDPATLAEIDWALFGPMDYAVIATTPTTPTVR